MHPLEPGAPDPDEESEGCLSFPGERFPLRRSERVLVTGIDLDGLPVRIEVDGWRARIMQHEFDHLDGILYIDRLSDARLEDRRRRSRASAAGAGPEAPGRQASTTSTPDDLDAGATGAVAARQRERPRGGAQGLSAPPLGLEPRTYRLTADCSAN